MASRVINKGIEQVAIDLLKHHPRNANHGDVEAIKKSLAVNGWYGSVVVNTATKHILAGNHRVMAAKALGWETVPVQWVDVTPEEELRILVVDNRTTRIGQDDTTKITDILAELSNTPIGLDGTGYSTDDLDALIDSLTGIGEPEELLTDPDEVPEEVETRCKPGDLWILGNHRLLCGDSTKAEDVERLMDGAKADMMFTDPPYNIDYQGVKDKREKIKNDKMPDSDFVSFLASSLVKHEVMYVCCSWQYSHLFKEAMCKIDCQPKAMIVWDKVNPAQHLDLYYKQHELIFYCGPYGGNKTIRGDVWQLKRQRNTVHPTMKPVELVSMAINDHPHMASVYDPFMGSGTTIIACEETNRKAYGLELDPHYCDVIIQRWENATGKKAVLHEG